jgi:hypothetical protein
MKDKLKRILLKLQIFGNHKPYIESNLARQQNLKNKCVHYKRMPSFIIHWKSMVKAISFPSMWVGTISILKIANELSPSIYCDKNQGELCPLNFCFLYYMHGFFYYGWHYVLHLCSKMLVGQTWVMAQAIYNTFFLIINQCVLNQT